MLKYSCNLPAFPIKTMLAAFVLVAVTQAISRETVPSADSNPQHISIAAKAASSARDSGLADSVVVAASHSVKEIIRVNDSLGQIDSLRKLALSIELRDPRSGGLSKQNLIQSKLDSLYSVDSLRREQQTMEIARLRKTVLGYPVILGSDTLFLIHVSLGPFTAKDRAQAISGRITQCADAIGFTIDSLACVPIESSNNILYAETILLTITQRDALWHNVSADSLSRKYLAIMKTAIVDYRKAHSFHTYLLRGIELVVILFILAVIVFFVRKLFRHFRRYLSHNRDKLIKGISIKKVSLLTKDMQHGIVLRLIGILEILTYIVIGFITLPFIFNVFPFTRILTDTLIGWILSPLQSLGVSILHFVPNVFYITVIIVVIQIAIRIAKRIFAEIEKGTMKFQGFYADWARPTYNIVRFLLYVLMFVMVFPYLPGSNSPVFRGVTIFLGLLFSLGATSATSNIIAGLVITYMRPFKKGDRIKIGDAIGDVIEKNLLVTRIITIKNEIITLPNASILTGHTINYSTDNADLLLILHTTVTIGYNAPWRTVHKLLIDAAKSTSGIASEKEPFVLQTSLNDFFISYELNAYTRYPRKTPALYSALHQNIQDKFNAANVEILSPHYRSVRNGNPSTVNDPLVTKAEENSI